MAEVLTIICKFYFFSLYVCYSNINIFNRDRYFPNQELFLDKKINILSEKKEKNDVNRVKIYVKNMGGGLTLKCV